MVAAGRGHRYGGLKQFALLNGIPLLAYSLVAFERSHLTQSVVVVTNRCKARFVRRLVARMGLKKVESIVSGGPTRFDSVRNGLKQLPTEGFVAVHDAARPFLTPQMVDEGFGTCRRLGPATYGHPVTDTLKQVSKTRIIHTLERSGICAVQTPQFFPIPLLLRAYHKVGRLSLPDDCAVVERLGLKPVLIPGPRTNIKITTRQDMGFARKLL